MTLLRKKKSARCLTTKFRKYFINILVNKLVDDEGPVVHHLIEKDAHRRIHLIRLVNRPIFNGF